MKTNFKKVVSLTLAAVLAASTLVGCKKGDGKIHVTIGGQPTERTEKNAKSYDLFQERKKAFEAENPNVVVEPDPFSFSLQDYMVKAAAGELPTLFNTSPTELNQVVATGYANDITELVKKYGYEDALGSNKEKYESLFMRDGKYYSIVVHDSLYNLGIAYNIPLFKQAGLVDEEGLPIYPQTWDELAETAKIIKDKTGKAGFAICTSSNHGGWHLMDIMWAFGADMMKIENGKWKATFASPEGVAALQYVKDLKWKYDVLQDELVATTDVTGKLLSLGDAAMAIYSPIWFDNMVRKYGMKLEDMAMSTLPAGPAGRYSQIGANIYIFGGNDEENEAVFKWLEFVGEGVKEVNEEAIKGWETSFAEKKEKGYVVGIDFGTPYENAERTKVRQEIMDKYRTVEDKNYENYLAGEGVEYKFEPERCVQQMYSTLDSAIQEVLQNKNADCKKVLEQAQADFQNNFLNNEPVN